MKQYKDITGQKFGRLTAIKKVGLNKSRSAMWLCKCDCGKEKTVNGKNLRTGVTRSCGCIRATETAEKLRKTSTTHGMTNSRLYGIWCGIKSRCYNKNRKNIESTEEEASQSATNGRTASKHFEIGPWPTGTGTI